MTNPEKNNDKPWDGFGFDFDDDTEPEPKADPEPEIGDQFVAELENARATVWRRGEPKDPIDLDLFADVDLSVVTDPYGEQRRGDPVNEGVEVHPVQGLYQDLDGNWAIKCPHCGHGAVARAEDLDADRVAVLQWLWETSDYGHKPVGTTKHKNKDVPDWIVGARTYGKLRYWGFVLGSAGIYSCLPLTGKFLTGKVRLPETCYVLDDKVVKVSDHDVDVVAAKGRKSRRKKDK